MKKLSIIFTLFITTLSFSQTVIKTEYKGKVSCSQKYGITITEGDFTLFVSYTDEEISFKTTETQPYTSYILVKQTDKYIIGKNKGENYCFYDKTKKKFFYIDYFMSRYMVGGHGAGYSNNKETVLKMMSMLKDSKTQKDVIAHLISQTEYDF